MSHARTIVFSTKGNHQRKEYVLTNDDYLTLLRAVEYEGEPRDAVAWTLLQRFAFLYPKYTSLAKFVRAYAQPVNPRWFRNGDKHKEWLDTLIRTQRLNEADAELKKALRREQYAITPLEKISKTTRDIVDTMFLRGDSPVPGSVHYRAPTVTTSSVEEAKKARAEFADKYQLQRAIEYGDPTRQNWFFGQADSLSFRIQAMLANANNLGTALLLLACTAGAANLIYRIYTGWRFSS